MPVSALQKLPSSVHAIEKLTSKQAHQICICVPALVFLSASQFFGTFVSRHPHHAVLVLAQVGNSQVDKETSCRLAKWSTAEGINGLVSFVLWNCCT